MSEQRLETIVPRPAFPGDASPGSRDLAPGAVARETGELLDDELEYVVGGLARVWVDSSMPGDVRPQHGPNGV